MTTADTAYTTWRAATADRVPVLVHPLVRERLRNALLCDARLRAMGYSQFIVGSLERNLPVVERWQRPDTQLVPILVAPEARDRLREALVAVPSLRGLGYSEFIMRALDALDVSVLAA